MISERKQLHRWYILLDASVVILSYFLSWYIFIYIGEEQTSVLPAYIYFGVLPFIVLIYISTNAFFSLYKPHRTENSLYEFYHISESNFIALLIINAILFIGSKNPFLYNFSRIMIFAFCIINTILQILSRNAVRFVIGKIRTRGFNQKHILLIGYSDASFRFIDKVRRNPNWGYNLHGIVDDTHKVGTEYRGVKVIGNISNLSKILDENNFDEIAITLALNEYDKLKNVVGITEKSGVHTKFVPDYGTMIPTNPVPEDLDGLPIINIRAVPLQGLFNRFIKRTVDIVGAIVGIIIFSPAMLVIAILIKITDKKSHVIFKQERVGRHNKLFIMYKFRSMKEQKDEDEKERWTKEGDERVTKVGKFIRSTSLDELPQFFNVLKGEMSLVGPRPERLQFVEKFKETIPRYMIKHQVRPGMTGWAQVNGFRGDTPIDKRIQYDLWYIENWTLGLDIKILIQTIFVGFINKNAY